MNKLFSLLFLMIIANAFAYGFAAHVSQYDKIITYYENHYEPDYDYYKVLKAWPQYFKYGSIFPDMQYINELKSSLQKIYKRVVNETGNHLTYEIELDNVPDVGGPNGSCSWGVDSHNSKYALQFAEYLLQQANLPSPPGVNPGAEGDWIDDPARGQKLAFACGYYNHLVMDIGAHNYMIPLLTAQSGLHELSVFKNQNESSTLSQIPGIQSHMFIEAMHDYRLGESANRAVANLVYNDFWVKAGNGTMEPPVGYIYYGGNDLLYGDDGTGNCTGINPALDFFYEVLEDWYNNNPWNLPEDYKIPGGNLISKNGFVQECHMFRFSNRFYPEMIGYGSLPETMTRWVTNHIDFEWYWDAIADAVWFYYTDWFHTFRLNYAYGVGIAGTRSDVAEGAVHTFLGMMNNDLDYIMNYVTSNDGEQIINFSEFERFLFCPVFYDINYFTMYSNIHDMEVIFFDQIGPPKPGNPALLYKTWASDYEHAYLWGVLESLNGYSDKYEKRTDIGVYDSYFLVDGQRYTYKTDQNQTGINHNFNAIAEIYALNEMASPATIIGKVYLDKSNEIGSNNSEDIMIKSTTISMQQNPIDYNFIDRQKIEINFTASDIPPGINIFDYVGFYLELSSVNNYPFFTMDWCEYQSLDIVKNNDRYNTGYDTYKYIPYAYSFGDIRINPETQFVIAGSDARFSMLISNQVLENVEYQWYYKMIYPDEWYPVSEYYGGNTSSIVIPNLANLYTGVEPIEFRKFKCEIKSSNYPTFFSKIASVIVFAKDAVENYKNIYAMKNWIAGETITLHDVNVFENAILKLNTSNSIHLKPGFEAKKGSNLSTALSFNLGNFNNNLKNSFYIPQEKLMNIIDPMTGENILKK